MPENRNAEQADDESGYTRCVHGSLFCPQCDEGVDADQDLQNRHPTTAEVFNDFAHLLTMVERFSVYANAEPGRTLSATDAVGGVAGQPHEQGPASPAGFQGGPSDPLRPVIRALARWASAWDDTHGKSFLAGDADGERLRLERDDAETALRQAWRELVDE